MSLRGYLHKLDKCGNLIKVSAPISKTYEIASVLKQLEPKPVMFECVKESPFRVMGNLFCDKASVAAYFGIKVNEIIPFLARAIDQRHPGEIVTNAPCQEVVVADPNLNLLPILRHCERDGGNYISSGVVITRHPQHGQNADFHRCMQFSPTEMAMRIVRARHFDTYLRDLGQLDVAVCVGTSPSRFLEALPRRRRVRSRG